MRFKRLFILGLSLSMMTILVGCGGSNDEIAELNALESANVESELTTNYNLSYTDEQSMVYSQVSDRQLLDLTTLVKCEDTVIQEVTHYMDAVNAQLIGSASTEVEETIDSCFTNYLLTAFEETPYYWQRTQTIIRGMDPESRAIIVDVKYHTIDFEKTVQADSAIPLGCLGYDKKLRNRYNKWVTILSMKMNNAADTRWQQEYNEFETYYGKFEDIYASQSNLTLTQQIYETGNQKTYNGMINSDAEQSGGTMTVRYVLVPNYVLGINLGLTCQHMYILDYKLDNDITAGMSLFTDEGYATVTDSVYNLIYSYFQCMDENDYSGLYKLTQDFGALDSHYEELFNTTYMKHNNFTISLFDIDRTNIKCGINVAVKKRAKGSMMTYPCYTDRYYCELDMVDDRLVVKELVLLSSTLEGEPSIKTEEADVLGFASMIDLDNADRQSIEELICNFGVLQLRGDTTSDDFGKVVDISISQSKMKELQNAMTSLNGEQKVVWLSNYRQGTSNYASVKCKELFQLKDNSIIEASVIYDFILKGDAWYVYNYNVTSSVRLSTTNLNMSGSLCLLNKDKVVEYRSQIMSTVSEVNTDANVSDVSHIIEHPEEKVTLKSGTTDLGIDKDYAYAMTEEDYNATLETLLAAVGLSKTVDEVLQERDDFFIMYDSYLEDLQYEIDTTEDSEELEAAFEEMPNSFTVNKYLEELYTNVVAIYYNKLNNRYQGSELEKAFEEFNNTWVDYRSTLQKACSQNEDCAKAFANVSESINKMQGAIRP